MRRPSVAWVRRYLLLPGDGRLLSHISPWSGEVRVVCERPNGVSFYLPQDEKLKGASLAGLPLVAPETYRLTTSSPLPVRAAPPGGRSARAGAGSSQRLDVSLDDEDFFLLERRLQFFLESGEKAPRFPRLFAHDAENHNLVVIHHVAHAPQSFSGLREICHAPELIKQPLLQLLKLARLHLTTVVVAQRQEDVILSHQPLLLSA